MCNESVAILVQGCLLNALFRFPASRVVMSLGFGDLRRAVRNANRSAEQTAIRLVLKKVHQTHPQEARLWAEWWEQENQRRFVRVAERNRIRGVTVGVATWVWDRGEWWWVEHTVGEGDSQYSQHWWRQRRDGYWQWEATLKWCFFIFHVVGTRPKYTLVSSRHAVAKALTTRCFSLCGIVQAFDNIC